MDEAQLCVIGEAFLATDRTLESAQYFERARNCGQKIGAERGFFTQECRACLGLGQHFIKSIGQVARMEGREEDAVEMLQRALAASSLDKQEDNVQELSVLSALTHALFAAHAIDEVEPLVLRYQEAAEAESHRRGRWTYVDIDSLYALARLHEARGRYKEAEREVRALLSLVRRMRRNRVFGAPFRLPCQELLREASSSLKVLDLEFGNKELAEAVAVEVAKLLSA